MDYGVIAAPEALSLFEAWLSTLVGDVKVALLTGVITPTPNFTLADMEALEPTASWYTRQAVVFGDVYERADNSLAAAVASKQFNYSGTDDPCVVYGWALVSSATPRILGVGSLSAPVSMSNTLDACIVQPALGIPVVLD